MSNLINNSVNKVIMYGFNFEHNFIHKVWSGNIANHLQKKFTLIYGWEGANAAFFKFYSELSQRNKEILINYINNK